MGVHTRESKTYLKVLASDGTLRLAVPEGTPGAVRRTYEDRDTKEEKVVFEQVFDFIDGMIGDVTIVEGKFGSQVMVPIIDGDTTFTLSLGLTSNFGEDFLKKLPNIDLKKPVVISPFSFTSDKGKPVRGMSIQQDFKIANGSVVGGTKIKNFFRDEEAKKNINGLPEPEGDTRKYDSDDWKVYFIKVRKFLVSFNQERGLIKDKNAVPETDVYDLIEPEAEAVDDLVEDKPF
jgi:hypothetical protein